jgi:glutathione S-transferase
MSLRLYTWWRSQASSRVRIALRLKGLHTEMSYVDLGKREQHDPVFAAINPAQALPVLIDRDGPPRFAHCDVYVEGLLKAGVPE